MSTSVSLQNLPATTQNSVKLKAFLKFKNTCLAFLSYKSDKEIEVKFFKMLFALKNQTDLLLKT